MEPGRTYEQERLAELIMHIANRSLGDARFGNTKLYKILFFADFEAYRRTGRSITGADYQHLAQGPCPHQAMPAIKSLGGDVAWREQDSHGYTQRQLIPLRPARLELFDGPEIAIVDEMIDFLRHMTNVEVSQLSHETLAWRISADRDQIPYGAALFSDDTPTDDDRAWLKEVARSEGLGSSAR